MKGNGNGPINNAELSCLQLVKCFKAPLLRVSPSAVASGFAS